jgi:hypothetical protein
MTLPIPLLSAPLALALGSRRAGGMGQLTG